MATTIYPANSGTIDAQAFSNLYNKTFDAVRAREDKVAREGAKYFTEESQNLGTHTVAEVGTTLNLPHVRTDRDSIPLFQPVQGHPKTFTKVIYKAGIIVTRQAIEEQKFKLIAQMIQGLPKAAARREEYSYADVFNGGFATNTTADGSYVFATDHVQFDPEQPAYSNRPVAGGAFTTTTLEAARLHFDTFVNEKGFPDPQMLSKIVYPPAMWEAVQKVLKSVLYPQNDLNAKNPFEGISPAEKYHYLTSSTAWFAQGSTSALDQGFVFVRFSPTTYDPISDSMNPDLIMGKRLRMAHAAGAVHARNWYGNPGA
jgi:hypothetical protein